MRTILEVRRSLVLVALFSTGFVGTIGCGVNVKGEGETGANPSAARASAGRETLRKLLVDKKTCADDAACPEGSYCASSTKTCTWDCLSSSDCGSGNVCSADGRCEPGARSSAFGSELGGPMRALAAVGGACSFSDECSNGSYCDRSSGTCTQACTSDAECGEHLKCTPQGACVGTNGRSLPVTTLSVTPSAFEVPRPLDVPDKLARTVRLRLEAKREAIASAPSVTVRVRQRAAGGVDDTGTLQAEVLCGDVQNNPSAAFSAACTFAMPPFAQTPAGFLSTQIVSVRLKDDATDPTKRWELVVESPGAIAPEAPAVFAMPFAVREAAAGPLEGEYAGALVVGGTAPGAEPSGLTPLRIPVKATVSTEGVVLVDESRQVSPTGKLFYPRTTPSSYTEDWIAARPTDPLQPDPLPNEGAVRATIARNGELAFRGGVLTGSVSLLLAGVTDTASTIAFELVRTGAGPACSATKPCEAGRHCATASNVCELDAPSRSTDPATNTLEHRQLEAWMEALPARVEGGLKAVGFDVVGKNQFGGFGNFKAPREMVGIELMRDRFDDLGFRICERDFPAFLQGAHSNKRWCGPYGSDLCQFACSASPLHRTTCEELYVDRNGVTLTDSNVCLPSESGGDRLEHLKKDFVPCTVPSSSSDFILQRPWRGTCSLMHTLSGETRSFEDYLAQVCYPRSRLLSSSSEETKVYMCPANRDSIFGPATGARIAERAACFDPAAATAESILDSARFGNKVLAASGELQCTNGAVPNAVPLVTYRDRVTDGVSDTVTADAMLDSCLVDLRRDVPSASSAAVHNIQSYFGAVQSSSCFNWGRFALGLSRSEQELPAYYLHLLRKWLTVQSFVGEAARMRWDQASVISIDAAATVVDRENADVRVLYGVLDRLERGLDLFLSEEMTARLLGMPASVHADPEYRTAYTQANLPPTTDQGVGLPVALLDAMAMHLRVLEILVDQHGTDAFAWCTDGRNALQRDNLKERIGTTLRYATAIESLALRLEAHARTAGAAIPWGTKWTKMKAEFAAVRHRVSKKSTDLFVCRNPLGIDADDVPLFFGDPVGATGRFFATSNHLIALAKAETNSAHTALIDARAAWNQARLSRIQDTVTALEYQRRVEELSGRYGAPILRACGLVGIDSKDALDRFDPTKPNPLAVETCHVNRARPGCEAGAETPECLRGSLGEAALTISAAAKDIEIARGQMVDLQTQYDQQFAFCTKLRSDFDTDQDFLDNHETELTAMRRWKLLADESAIAAGAAYACANGGVNTFLSAGTNCVFAAAAGVANGISAALAVDMANKEANHQALMRARENDRVVTSCFHEADQRYVGIKTAGLQLERRLIDMKAALLAFQDQQDFVRQQITEGLGAVEREKVRRAPSVAHHYWADEKVAFFKSVMDRAKRLTYRAVQAVNYDYQESLASDIDVVVARHPNELFEVLRTLEGFQTMGQVNRRRPAPLQVVLSLRDDVLGLRLNRQAPVAEEFSTYEINPRLQERLAAPDAAFFDRNGRYVGQAIPFTLQELPEASSRCGERVWSVAATILGEGLAREAPRGQLQILKRNTFYSKWCEAHGDGSAVQVGRIRPSGTLFGQSNSAGVLEETQSFVGAMMLPWFNKPRAEFYADANTAGSPLLGATEELAGRGLYGDYVLIFPYYGLLDQVNVSAIEDVLLRFDYYSIDNTTVP